MMKKNRCDEDWKNVHTNIKTVNFSFGPVTYRHTTMRDGRGALRHPLNKWLGIEVSQAIVYEGWNQNGKHVALNAPMVVMSTEAIDDFWNEVQTMTAMTHSLEQTQAVANSDGGVGYGEERFKATFSQSEKEALCQIDKYHVSQAIIRTFGAKKSDMKTHIKKAIEAHNHDQFTLWMDTYESTEDDPKKLKRLSDFKTYILNHWHRHFDWRDKVAHVPDGARTLGAMESN